MTAELLTQAERDALALSGELANQLRAIIGDGNQADYDWAETAADIHRLQQRIMSQAAARAYPKLCRPLGGWPK